MSGRNWKAKIKNAVSGLRAQADEDLTGDPPGTLPPTISVAVPPPIRSSLRLLSPSNLEVTVYYADHVVQSHQNLNDLLGNDDGNFSPQGKNFSQSAKNVRLVDFSLWASLATRGGVWQHDRVGLDLQVHEGGMPEPKVSVVDYKDSHTPSLPDPRSRLAFSNVEDLRDLIVISKFLLAADCRQPDGSYATSFLDLDGYIGNDNGRFVRGRDFSQTAEDVTLSGTTLSAHISRQGGRKVKASTDISRYVFCQGGRLLPIQVSKPEYGLPQVHQVSNEIIGFLPGCHRAMIISPSTLLAECYTDRGSTQKVAFRLNSLFGVTGGRLRPFGFDFTRGDDPVKQLELKGTILYMKIPQPADRKEKKSKIYETNAVDLKRYLINEHGSLTLRKGGNGCAGCANIFRAGMLYSPWGKKQRERLMSLDDSLVNNTCGLCRLTRSLASANNGSISSTEVFIETWTERLNDNYYINTAELEIKRKGVSSERHTLFLDTDFETNSPAFGLLARRQVSDPWLQPGRRWSLISAWVEECFHAHKGCARRGRPFLPTRCLDLGTHPGDKVQVITPTRALGRYACLSHCWGNVQTCTLTTETFERYTTGVSVTDLPTTYSDAIAVSRYLGIRYLWIDSLCIIQDSREDWLRECPKMTDYYGHCYVCIAATSSAGSNGGLKIHSRPSAINAEGSDTDGNWYNLIAYPSESLQDIPHFSRADFNTLEQYFPLMRRGWVLQERWLAPRTIHFGGKEVIFECSEGLACECGHAQDSFWVDVGDRGYKMSVENMNDGAVLKRADTKKMNWSQLVAAYSALNLTFPNDRLPAISGLARDFANAQSSLDVLGNYVAGLWEKNLADELVWFVGAPLLRARTKSDDVSKDGFAKFWTAEKVRVDEYVAPTWSWASVFEAVSYRTRFNNQPLYDLLEFHVALRGSDRFGSLSQGCYLKIKGRLARTRWEVVTDGSENVPYLLTSMTGSQFLDRDDKSGIGFLPDYMIGTPDSTEIPLTEDLFVLPVLTQQIFLASYRFTLNRESEQKIQKEKERLSRIRNTLCLVLRRCELADVCNVQAYERIGFTEYANIVGNEAIPDPNEYEDATILLI